MLRKLLSDQQPDLVAAAFDLKGPTFRHELAADYKATRRPMPEDLVEQVPWVHEACAALGVPVVTHAGFEADDVIGTLATQAVASESTKAAAKTILTLSTFRRRTVHHGHMVPLQHQLSPMDNNGISPRYRFTGIVILGADNFQVL